MGADHSLGRRERLCGRSNFEQVKQKGRTTKGKYLILSFYQNKLAFNRIGISLSKRVSLKSCRRHRIKRLVSECYRRHKPELKTGFDIVVRARPIHENLTFSAIEKDLIAVLEKAGMRL